MANNKKKPTAAAIEKKKNRRHDISTVTDPLQGEPVVGPLAPGRFHMLLLLSIGISRILQWRSAANFTQSDDDPAVNVNPTCLEYLGDKACQNQAVQTLLHLKFASGMQLSILVIIVAMHLWYNEPALRQFNVKLIFSPMIASVVALYFAASRGGEPKEDGTPTGIIPTSYFYKHVVMCLVLTAVVKPNKKKEWPFLSTTASSEMTLQGLWLLCLAVLYIYQTLCVVFPQVFIKTEDGTTFDNFVDYLIPSIHGKVHPAAHAITDLLAVDRIMFATTCAFMFYHVNESHQRSFLVFISALHAFTFFGQTPYFSDKLGDCISIIRAMNLMVAILSVVAAFAPQPKLVPQKKKSE